MFPPRLVLIYLLQIAVSLFLTKVIVRRWQVGELSGRQSEFLLLAAVICNVIFYFLTNYYSYCQFNFGNADLATFNQNLWNIINHRPPIETAFGPHMLRDHFSPIFYLVAFIYKFWPSCEFLILLNTLLISASSYFIYLLARETLQSEWLGLALGVSFLLNPYTQMTQLGSIHGDSLNVFFISMSLYFLCQKKWTWFLISMAAGLAGKEDVGLYYAAIGIFVFLGMNKKLWGVAIAIIGLGWVILVNRFFMPAFGPDTLGMIGRFSALGNGFEGIIKNIVLHPWVVITPILTIEKLSSIFYLLVQTGFCSIFSGWAIVPMLAAIWFKSITNYLPMYNFWDQYSLHVLPFIYFASVFGLAAWINSPRVEKTRSKLRLDAGQLKIALAFFLIILSFLINFERGNNPLSRKFSLKPYQVTEHHRLGIRILEKIPKDASVLAQEQLAPRLSARKEIYIVSSWQHWKKGGKALHEPAYVAFDLKQAQELGEKKEIFETADYFYASHEYEVIASEDGWVIFKKRVVI